MQREQATRIRYGFSLVELLVVVAIFAVLLGMVIPGLQVARTKSRSAACRSNLQQMGVAMEEYKADHNDFIPFRLVRSGQERPTGTSWANLLLDSACAQGDPRGNRDRFSFTQYCGDAGILKCPEMAGKPGRSYGRNQRIGVRHFRQVTRPDEFPLALDSSMDRPRYYANLAYRHTNAANALYMDGHVARIDYNGLRIFGYAPLPGWPSDDGFLMPIAFHVVGAPVWDSVTFRVLQDAFEIDSRTLLPGGPGSGDNVIEFDPVLLDPVVHKVELRVAVLCRNPDPDGVFVFHVRAFDRPWKAIGRIEGKGQVTEATFDLTWYLKGVM